MLYALHAATQEGLTPVNSTLLQLSALLGLVMPVLVSVVKQDGLPRRINSVISVVITVLAALVTCVTKGELTGSNLLGSFVALYIASAASYHSFFGPTGFDAILSDITSFLKNVDKPAALVTMGEATVGGAPAGDVVAAPPGT